MTTVCYQLKPVVLAPVCLLQQTYLYETFTSLGRSPMSLVPVVGRMELRHAWPLWCQFHWGVQLYRALVMGELHSFPPNVLGSKRWMYFPPHSRKSRYAASSKFSLLVWNILDKEAKLRRVERKVMKYCQSSGTLPRAHLAPPPASARKRSSPSNPDLSWALSDWAMIW